MNLLEAVLNAQNGGAARQVGQNFGLNEQQTTSAISSLLPALAGGLKQNASSPDGFQALMSALSSGNHQQYIDNPASLGQPSTVQEGNGILGHILGSKDVSRNVAQQASAQSGVGADVLKQMLPVVAAMAMGALSRHNSSAPASGFQAAPQSSGLMGMLTPMLDSNRDGSMVDDAMGMLGKLMK